MNTREVTRQYRLNQWTEIIRECRSSGQTLSSWCAENNVNVKSYYYWLRKVRTAACETLPVAGDNPKSIVPVNMTASMKGTALAIQETPGHITLRVGTITLAVHNGATADLIENTLRAITHVR